MLDDQHAQIGAIAMPTPAEGGPVVAASLDAAAMPVTATVEVDGSPGGPVDQAGRPGDGGSGATASQLRRFIKSRPWVPMHELRRRFGIEGTDDEMSPVDLKDGRIFVGLPPREAALLGDLFRQGEIGFELVHDPDCPAVAGVYPMRPVVRQ